MDLIPIVKGVSIVSLALILMGGIGFWIRVLIKKKAPNLKFWFAYKFLRKKYDPQKVEYVMDTLEKNKSQNDFLIEMLCEKNYSLNEAKENLFIYERIKKKNIREVKNE